MSFNKLLFDSAKKTDQVLCMCDYCGSQFKRLKHVIIRSNKIVSKDSCGSKECTVAKRRESHIVKFGCDNPMKNDTCRDKQKMTCLEKYGVDNIFKDKNKIKNTIIDLFGVDHPSKSPEVKNKKKEKSQERFGTDNPMQSDVVKNKVKQTCLDKYGVDCAFQADEVKIKIKETNIERHGVENPSKSKNVQEKRRKTFQDKFGVDNPFASPIVREAIKKANIEKYGSPYPPHPHYVQDSIREWLNSFNFNFEENWEILGNKQIDLYDSTLNIGIEYCGLYWHTELSPTPRPRNYHYDKYKRCADKNIHLLTIFSDEWLNRQEQCKNYIKSLLHVYEQKLHARQCKVIQVEKSESLKFIEANHIQGTTNQSIVFYGLEFDKTLVGVMSLGRHPRNASSLLLDRLCFANNVQVVGGASRLLKACISWCKDNGHSTITSFSDNRWSQGKIYNILGFELTSNINPDYSYVSMRNPSQRLSKQSQMKSKTSCPDNVTEKDWAASHGLARIWDCGKKRWKLII